MKKTMAFLGFLVLATAARAGTVTMTITGEDIDDGSVTVELLAGYANGDTSFTMTVAYPPEIEIVPNSMTPIQAWNHVGPKVQAVMVADYPRLKALYQAGNMTGREVKQWLVDKFNELKAIDYQRRLKYKDHPADRLRKEVYSRILPLQRLDRKKYELEALP